MSTKTTLISIAILLAVSIAISAWAYPMLPEQVASHWNASDQVDGYMSRFWGAAFTPLLGIGLALLLMFIPNLDPLKKNVAEFREPYNTFVVVLLGFLLYVHGLTLAYSLGYTFRMSQALVPALGLIFVFAGWMMAKAKRNYFIGIRTPWTLANDQVWDETHRLGSKLFIAAGALSMLTVFLGEGGILWMPVLILTAAIIPTIYSYIIWRRIEKGQ